MDEDHVLSLYVDAEATHPNHLNAVRMRREQVGKEPQLNNLTIVNLYVCVVLCHEPVE